MLKLSPQKRADMIAESNRRKSLIFAHYDPLTGEGSFSVPRRAVTIIGMNNDKPLFLPVDFANTELVILLEQFGVDKVLHTTLEKDTISKEERQTLFDSFNRQRVVYDFEFYAVSCCKISAKGEGRDIAFRLNYPQRLLLEVFENLRLAGLPIDVIICKARQWGGSTLTQNYMVWLQTIHHHNWNSAICGDVENQSRIVTGMLQKVIDNYPDWLFDGERVKTSRFQGSSSTRVISATQSRYSVGSAQKPDKLRSEDISMAHLTEVGLWKETKGKTPEDLVQGIFGSIASGPDTMKVMESTAKGVGNYFHKAWKNATSGTSSFKPLFIPWFKIEKYFRPFTDYDEVMFDDATKSNVTTHHTAQEQLNDLLDNFSDYDLFQWNQGACLEAINWYHYKCREEGFAGNRWRMCSEYPTTAQEAFQSTGSRVFSIEYVERCRTNCIPPIFIGNFVSDNGTRGEDSLTNIHFLPASPTDDTTENFLYVWSLPNAYRTEFNCPLDPIYRPHAEGDYRVLGRYIVSCDTGAGISTKADFSCIKVMDLYPILSGGCPEVVAVWHGRVEPDYIPWIAARIAKAYENALLVIESNKLESEKTMGDNTEFILSEIATCYENLYSRTDPTKIAQGAPAKYGFHTNRSTKPMIITELNRAMRDEEYVERDDRTCDEYDTYEIKEDLSMGAASEAHDDRVMATAILIHIVLTSDHPKVVLDLKTKPKNVHNTIVSEASM